MLREIKMINNDTWRYLKQLIENTAPGVTIEVHFYKGTQAENMEGSSFDDDFWSIEGFGSTFNEQGEHIKYCVTDDHLSIEIVKRAGKRILEMGLGW